MDSNLRHRYTPEFYRQGNAGSLPSAQVCVPLILHALQPTSAIDIGCGRGEWLSVMIEAGVTVTGVDGPHVTDEQLLIPAARFMRHDLATPLNLTEVADVVMCLEVGEHLPAVAAPDLVRTLTRLAPAVVFSAAVPFQGGVHHVNEQWPWYWQRMFAAHGFVCLDAFRKAIWHDDRVADYYQQNLMLYVDPYRHASLVARYPLLQPARQLTLVQSYILERLTTREPAWRDRVVSHIRSIAARFWSRGARDAAE